jgi:hypothetical protein
MTTGTHLNVLSAELSRLQNDIRHEALRLVAEGASPAVDDPGYRHFFDKLGRWEARLYAIRYRLQGMERDLAFKHEHAKGAPRDFRFRERQSVQDRQKHLDLITQQANRASAHLMRIYEIALTPTAADVNERVFRLLEAGLDQYKLFAELEKLSLHQASTTVTVAVAKARQELHAPRPGAGDPLLVLVLVTQLLRIWWLERLRQDKAL